MNFTTHVIFGILVATLIFGYKPEIILLAGVGSAIPDLDREYAFFSRDKYRDSQLHRALCHNYLFIGLLYLVSPYLALGAFLHTVLDALTTAKDRGVEWLFPFSRLVKSAANDEKGNQLQNVVPKKVYFYQNDPIELTRKSDKDLAEKKPGPWRRTYGPALSGGLLDIGIFFGSLGLLALYGLLIYLKSGLLIKSVPTSYSIPFVIGVAGISLNMLAGEIDRRKEIRKPGYDRPPRLYEIVFAISLALAILAIASAAWLNIGYVTSLYSPFLPFIVAGVIIVLGVASALIKAYSRLPFFHMEHHSEQQSEGGAKTFKFEDEPVIV
jgi:LexA-binding, inner membrane-associated putative hydrolase